MGWTYDIYALIPHPAEWAVLISLDGDRWTLPRFQRTEGEADFAMNEPERLNRVIRQRLGLEARVLHNFRGGYDREAEHLWLVSAHECPAAGWRLGDSYRWAGRRELDELGVNGVQRRWLEDWLDEQEKGLVPERRPRWARPGWHAKAEAWIEQQLKAVGRTAAGRPTVVKQWSISCVLRTPVTGGGNIYFKATLCPLFANEPTITQAVGLAFPDTVLAPLAIEAAESWMLLPEFAGPNMADVWLEHGASGMAALGRLQVAAAGRSDEWLAAGCMDRRLERLPGQLEALMGGPIAQEILPGEMLEQVQVMAPRVSDLCAALARYGVPESLVHGDFHGANVVIEAGRPVIFDWTDGCIAHPFLDLATCAGDEEYATGVPSEAVRHYLACWQGFEPMERLQEAFALALPLGALHQMVSYGFILGNVEPETRWETAGGLTYFARRFLAGMKLFQS
jgi:hypothetical protein